MSCSHEKVQVVNSDQNNKYSKCILCQPLTRYETVLPTLYLDFSNIIGYEEIKGIIKAIIDNSYTDIKRTHLLLAGDPSTAKTVFLKTIEKNLKRYNYNVHYVNAESMTSAGVIDYLFNHDVEFLMLDEIDKLEKRYQKTFLNLLENGVLQETKFKKTRKKTMENFVCISTANYVNRILEPLLTRFMLMYLRAYTQPEFYAISIILLERVYDKTREIAEYITDNVWNIYQNYRHEYPTIRAVVQVATLSTNDKASVDIILAGLKQHSTKYESMMQ